MKIRIYTCQQEDRSQANILHIINAQRQSQCAHWHAIKIYRDSREAHTVILLPGVPKASPPNIINVAVSRAKQNLYVVGSAAAWAGAGTSLQVLQRQLVQ